MCVYMCIHTCIHTQRVWVMKNQVNMLGYDFFSKLFSFVDPDFSIWELCSILETVAWITRQSTVSKWSWFWPAVCPE